MNIVTLGVPGTLAGLLLVGLTPSAESGGSPGGSPGGETCTSLVSYDFSTAPAPIYGDEPDFWRHPDWIPVVGFAPVDADFPDLVLAQAVRISGGELTYSLDLIHNNTFSAAVFAPAGIDANALDMLPAFDAYGGTTKITAEVGLNFHDAKYDADEAASVGILSVYGRSCFNKSVSLTALDADGPPSGDIVLRLTYCAAAGGYTTVTVATKPRSFADGLHVFRVEMTPSTPEVPGSTTNHTLNNDGIARVYIDSVLEYEDTSIQFRTEPQYRANINDAFEVCGFGVGHRIGTDLPGFGGGYTYIDFGYCEADEDETPPEEPIPGGELPPGVEPEVDTIPVGIIRIFALLQFGEGSPYTEIAVAETTLNDPDSWYGGVKQPWLLGVSSITRELADTLRGTEVTVTVADPERVFRALATTDTLSGATMEIYLVSDTVRYALGEPHRRFAGRVHDHRALPGFRYEFVLRDILSDEMADLADAPVIPPGKLTQELFPGMTADYEGRAIPIAIGEVSDEHAVPPQGVVPPLIVSPSINLATAFGGLNVDVVAAILSHGALPPSGIWEGYYNPVDNPYIRIPIPDSAWGTILTAPGQPGWNYVGVATDYVDYPLPLSDLTHRYTPVFFLASDPNVQAVLDGRIQVAFNVYGLTDEPDGSGLYFADAPDVYEFLIRNYLYQPHWKVGAYNGTPTFPRGYTIVNHTSVVTSRNRLRAFLGSPGEYPVGFLLGRDGQQQTLRHVLQELCFGVLMEQGIDRHGRILLDVEDVDADASITLSDIHDIAAGEFTVWVDRTSFRTTAEFRFGRRYLPAVAPLPTPPEGEALPAQNVGAHNDWQSIGAYTHEDAKAANGGKDTAPMLLENYVVRSTDVAVSWVTRIINRGVGPSPSYDGQRLFRLTTSWQALGVELGDVIAIDHIEGLGENGYEGQTARVLRITDDLQAARITLEGRVLFGEDA